MRRRLQPRGHMIYCVELAFAQPAREREWSDWYSRHLGVLLSVPGFGSAQRFVSVTPCRAPYLAAYSVTSAEVFDSGPYRARGGRASPGEWVPLMINWDRNVFDGCVEMPAVAADQYLAVVDRPPQALAQCSIPLQPLQCVGLDRTVASRGIAVLSASEYAGYAALAGEDLRFYRSLTPQLRVPA
jgi:hypothetical protein